MKQAWRIFLIVEALLFLVVSYQLIKNIAALIFVSLAFVTILFAIKKEKQTSFNQFQIIVSLLVITLILLINAPAVWVMLVLAIIFFGIKGFEFIRLPFINDPEGKRKELLMVETVEPENKNGRRFKRKWLSNQRIGDNVYEWDDINMTILSGDTLVDLGNTLLPKEDNVIMIRKAYGRTRLLVPVGIGVMVEHGALNGHVHIDGQSIKLKNEAIKCYSDDFSTAQRRLKVVSNVLVGDLEVIRI